MKKCSYCAEDIQEEAIVCPNCNHDLVSSEPDIDRKSMKERSQKQKGQRYCGCVVIALIVIIIVIFVSLWLISEAIYPSSSSSDTYIRLCTINHPTEDHAPLYNGPALQGTPRMIPNDTNCEWHGNFGNVDFVSVYRLDCGWGLQWMEQEFADCPSFDQYRIKKPSPPPPDL
jgi:hypothetical protein